MLGLDSRETETGIPPAYNAVSTQTSRFIAQANSIILARQDLSLNEAKFIRLIMMQIFYDDQDFRSYAISLDELGSFFGWENKRELARRAESFCSGIMRKTFQVINGNGDWLMAHWVEECRYDAGARIIYVRLSEIIKPYLLNLRGFYTQYRLSDILQFRSVASIRLYEMLLEEQHKRYTGKNGEDVYLSISQIRDGLMLYKEDGKGGYQKERGRLVPAYSQVSMLRKKVIDVAIREISEKTTYRVSCAPVKKGKKYIGFQFRIYGCHVPKNEK